MCASGRISYDVPDSIGDSREPIRIPTSQPSSPEFEIFLGKPLELDAEIGVSAIFVCHFIQQMPVGREPHRRFRRVSESIKRAPAIVGRMS